MISRYPGAKSDEIRLTSTVASHGTKHTSVVSIGIGIVQFGSVWNQNRVTEKGDGLVEVVVGQVHELLLGEGYVGKSGWSLDGAGEVVVLRRERSLPHVCKLVKDIWYSGLVGVVVHEGDNTLAAQDHLGQSWPIVEMHGHLGRDVEIWNDSRGLESRDEVLHSNRGIVAVDNEKSDDVERVALDPLQYCFQLGLVCAGV